MRVLVSSIICDTALQMRVKRDLGLITQYADAIEGGTVMPPIIVFTDDPDIEHAKLWLGDGWHRIEAHVTLALDTIDAEVRPGGRRAAFLFSLGANESHGLRRTTADKRKAVAAALDDLETRQLSDREIGRLCGVDKNTVASVRAVRPVELLDTKRKGRDGRVRGARKTQPVNSPDVMAKLGEMTGAVRDAFEAMPEDKRHLFCVELYRFICQNDPEVDHMNRTARQTGDPTVHKLLTSIPPEDA